MTEVLYQLKNMPKFELHAHLNGSISFQTLSKLYNSRHEKASGEFGVLEEHSLPNSLTLTNKKIRSMSECFQVFSLIHSLVSDCESVFNATCDVISEFAEDNVKYLELRTTPRENQFSQLTYSLYVDSVLAAIAKCKENGVDIVVRLLLSFDRGKPISSAREVYKLLEQYRNMEDEYGPIIIGVDYSGNPAADNTEDFSELIREVKKLSYKITSHISELKSQNDTELILSWQPDRLGHGTYLFCSHDKSQNFVDIIKNNKIPLEFCLTSNLITKTVNTLADHHLHKWAKMSHPFVICTDDKGIFSTSLSEEYLLAHKYLNFSPSDLRKLSEKSLKYAFCHQSLKNQLHETFFPALKKF